MATLKNKSVFLVRTVQINGRVYTLRNAHGFPLLRPTTGSPSLSSSLGGAQ
jgi:hypothetical protein